MTTANGIIDRAARNADKLPLERIAAAMLGVAAAFFCFAMPQRVLDATLGSLGVPVPVGGVGRLLFILCCAALAAGLGWLAVTVAASSASAADAEREIDLDPPQPRRRSIGPSDPREALGAPLPTLLAVRRGDGHPDAPPRRPIFADHDLPALDDDLTIEEPEAARVISAPASEFRIAADPAAVRAAEPPVPAELPVAAEPQAVVEPAAGGVEAAPHAAAAGNGDAANAPVAATAEGEPLDLSGTLPGGIDTPPTLEDTPVAMLPAATPAAVEPLPAEAVPAAAETSPPIEEVKTIAEMPALAEASPPIEEAATPVATQPAEVAATAAAAPSVEETSRVAEAGPETVAESRFPVDETPPAAVAPQPAAERPLAELMARLETGLDQQGGDLPLPPPLADTVTPLHEPTPAPDDALRNALEALQRLAERQR